ncbi:hypothetical protein ANN_16972 [Periplaneta americana]|uniref:Mos1 transposase HTH domain-containing protein n=1 Tax=Periplaneta americana TaxID=6978 RepID=A0ABQ8SRL2_PERAM|nr:hypothetical protein ANN_16972 [Periplaneta americana]
MAGLYSLCYLWGKEDEVSSGKNEHFRYILRFEFDTGAKAAETSRNICTVYGENSIRENTARKWFFRFNTASRTKIMSLSKSRVKRPPIDPDALKKAVEAVIAPPGNKISIREACSGL